jgi:hypothetical protein
VRIFNWFVARWSLRTHHEIIIAVPSPDLQSGTGTGQRPVA